MRCSAYLISLQKRRLDRGRSKGGKSQLVHQDSCPKLADAHVPADFFLDFLSQATSRREEEAAAGGGVSK